MAIDVETELGQNVLLRMALVTVKESCEQEQEKLSKITRRPGFRDPHNTKNMSECLADAGTGGRQGLAWYGM